MSEDQQASTSIAPSRTAQVLRAPVTLCACALATVVFVGVSAEGPNPSWAQLAKWGYVPAERIWDGAIWPLISSVFVHFYFWHLAFNVYWLWHLGAAVERTIGSIRWLGFVLAAAFVSSACQLALSSDTGVGASGVVYALFGLVWWSRNTVPAYGSLLGDRTAPIFLLWLIGCVVATRAGWVQIGNAAHVGGLLFGVLIAEWRVRRGHRKLAAASTVALGVFSLLATRTNPWSGRWLQHVAIRAHMVHRYDTAAWAYQRSLSFGTDSAWALYNLALAFYEMGDTVQYTTAFRTLRRIAPADADSLALVLKGLPFVRRGSAP